MNILMDSIFQTLTNMNTDLMMVIVFTIFFTCEQLFVKPFGIRKNAIHLLPAVLLQALYILINIAFAATFVVCCNWIGNNHIGIFNLIEIPYVLKMAAGFLAIDFVSYWTHRWYHRYEIFWRLHRVHHSDTQMDSSTSLRFHPLDALLDNASTILAAFIFGLDINIIIIRWIIYMPLFFAQHSSINFPEWIDRLLSKIFVTPNFHKVHHHQNQQFTDSNYGNIFIFWDKLFNTYKSLPVKEIKFGLVEFDTQERQTFWFLLKSPLINIKQSNKDDR